MKPGYIIYLAAAVVSLALFFYMRSDGVRIKRTFDAIAGLASKAPAETVMENAARSRRIAGYIAESSRWKFDGYGGVSTMSRADAAGAVLAARAGFDELAVTFADLGISSGGGEAVVTGEARLEGVSSGGGLPLPSVFAFRAALKDEAGTWVFTDVDIRRVVDGNSDEEVK